MRDIRERKRKRETFKSGNNVSQHKQLAFKRKAAFDF